MQSADTRSRFSKCLHARECNPLRVTSQRRTKTAPGECRAVSLKCWFCLRRRAVARSVRVPANSKKCVFALQSEGVSTQPADVQQPRRPLSYRQDCVQRHVSNPPTERAGDKGHGGASRMAIAMWFGVGVCCAWTFGLKHVMHVW